MVTGDVVLEAFLVEVFYNAFLKPEIEDQPTKCTPPHTYTQAILVIG